MDMRHAHPLGPLEHNMQCCSIKDRIILYPYTGSPKTKRSPLVGSGIFYMDPGPSNQDHSLFGLLDFQLYHAEVDITFFLFPLFPSYPLTHAGPWNGPLNECVSFIRRVEFPLLFLLTEL